MAAAFNVSYEPSVKNIIDQQSLKWIFVGGKGGVGKTTVSCSLAIQLSRVRESVLIISTDPAHNLSDAFGQKFSAKPQLVEGCPKLSAMELDPSAHVSDLPEIDEEQAKQMKDMVSELYPGLDEFIGFTALFKLVKQMEYSVVVFDTAPSGHTKRMLGVPMMVSGSFSGLFRIMENIVPVAAHVAELLGRLEVVDTANTWLRAMQEKPNDMRSVVEMLKDAIEDLYQEDFHITRLPMMAEEVRKVDTLSSFSDHLVQSRPSLWSS